MYVCIQDSICLKYGVNVFLGLHLPFTHHESLFLFLD